MSSIYHLAERPVAGGPPSLREYAVIRTLDGQTVLVQSWGSREDALLILDIFRDAERGQKQTQRAERRTFVL